MQRWVIKLATVLITDVWMVVVVVATLLLKGAYGRTSHYLLPQASPTHTCMHASHR